MAAILGLQMMLSAVGIPGYVNDTMMLYNTGHHEFHLKGSGLALIVDIIQTKTAKGMRPGSKQRKDVINLSKPSRRKAATLFNSNKYALSDTIEGIFESVLLFEVAYLVGQYNV
ncbi:MAG: hypothetical protein F4W68_02735, partial [Cenarchaeum sp. SB0661_bin_35]|nr:hypothetical protein [Cenarchaeum sp. SB0661_bin_35]